MNFSTEILLEIFIYAVVDPSDVKTVSPLVLERLRLVCSRWRAIVDTHCHGRCLTATWFTIVKTSYLLRHADLTYGAKSMTQDLRWISFRSTCEIALRHRGTLLMWSTQESLRGHSRNAKWHGLSLI